MDSVIGSLERGGPTSMAGLENCVLCIQPSSNIWLGINESQLSCNYIIEKPVLFYLKRILPGLLRILNR